MAQRAQRLRYQAIACAVASVLPKIDSNYRLVLDKGYELFGEDFKNAVIRYIHDHDSKKAVQLAIQRCLKKAKEAK
jgi:hypothetical protein